MNNITNIRRIAICLMISFLILTAISCELVPQASGAIAFDASIVVGFVIIADILYRFFNKDKES